MPTISDKPIASKAFRVQFDPKTATLETVLETVKIILDRSGCGNCGRLGALEIEIDPRVYPVRDLVGVREISEVVRGG